MFGMLSSGALVQRIGYRLTLIIGLVLMAAGMALLVSGPWLLGMIAVCVLGVGHGITTPAGNLRTAEVNPHGGASALNLINAVWGIGAVSSPFLVAIAQRAHQTPVFLYGTASALLILLLAFAFARFQPDTRARAKHQSTPGHSVWRHRLLPVICVLFFVYVGSETSFGGWLTLYSSRMGTGQHSFWAMPASFFWGALLAGRLLAPLALKFHKVTAIARIALALALTGGLAISAVRCIALRIPAPALPAFGLPSTFPFTLSPSPP